MKTKSEIAVTKWDEKNCGKVNSKMVMSRASIIYKTNGSMQGEINVEYIIHYTNYDIKNQHNSEATYIGYMIFSGIIDGKSGTFVLEENGQYSPIGPLSSLSIKKDTGTGELTGISGKGSLFPENSKMFIEYELH